MGMTTTYEVIAMAKNELVRQDQSVQRLRIIGNNLSDTGLCQLDAIDRMITALEVDIKTIKVYMDRLSKQIIDE